ncbi:MAG: hypothetical protein H5U01_06135, partial [Clostridia bacterium]|nr:hypothetical protein [Clostridia bacterium]
MVKRLEEILEKENIEILQDVLWEIARRADGSLRDAISLLEQLLAFGGEITLESLERNFGILSRSEVMEKIPLFREGKWEEVFLWINSLKERGVMVPYLFEDLGEIFRRIWVFKLSSRADEIFGLSASEREFYHTESKHWDEDVLWSILNIVERRGDRIRMGSSPFRELEMFFWELKKKMSSELLSLEKRDFPTDEARSDEGKVKREVLKTEVTAKDVGTQKNDLEKLEEFLSKLKERKISLYTFMLEADRSIRDGKLRIEYPSELRFHYEQIRRPENMAILKDVLKEV